MSEKDAIPVFPRVTEDDIVTASLEKLTDPKDLIIFDWLKTENPLLAKEIIRRAYYAIHEADKLSSVELLALFMENALFSVQALRAAVIRQRQEDLLKYPEVSSLPSDGGDGEGQPLST